MHIHVSNDESFILSGRSRQVHKGMKGFCRGIIVLFSGKGCKRDPLQCLDVLYRLHDVALPSTDSVNIQSIMVENRILQIEEVPQVMKGFGLRHEIRH